MQVNNVLVYQTNNLAGLTVNSIKKNMPDWNYKVVKCGESKIGTALKNVDGITLVVQSGVILDVKLSDLPPIEKLQNYHMAVSRELVFGDHHDLCGCYQTMTGKHLNRNILDLSVFVINPDMWDSVPKSDVGILADCKTLYMPRYMNHKMDILVPESLSAYDCFKYGLLGESASVLNYVGCFEKGKVSASERFAYCLDKALDYLDDLSEGVQNKIKKVSVRNQNGYSKFRKRMEGIR